VKEWITHNEPWVIAFLGHAEGVKAPGIRDWVTALRASHHLLLSHGMAARALRAHGGPGTRVGITCNLAPVRAASESEADQAAASRMDGHLNRWFLDPVFRGAYPPDMVELYGRRYGWPLDAIAYGDLGLISAPVDFLGVNYYMPLRVREELSRAPLGLESVSPRPPLTAMGWEVDADGLHEVLLRVRRDYGDVPVYITENGAAFDDEVTNGRVDDPDRVAYVRDHLAALRRAVADGVDVQRYYVWSLLDNFEWEHGYAKRFGIVRVDYATQRRIPKRSGLWYRDFIARERNGAA
ncbi:MAG: family 1 glycosylhydrolase, partial [Actinomycetota bacterium]|nr:family 1 glycosylhydrolase [Actinomycetota bacterium]